MKGIVIFLQALSFLFLFISGYVVVTYMIGGNMGFETEMEVFLTFLLCMILACFFFIGGELESTRAELRMYQYLEMRELEKEKNGEV